MICLSWTTENSVLQKLQVMCYKDTYIYTIKGGLFNY